MSNDDFLSIEEDQPTPDGRHKDVWKVLVVDDEPDVHTTTQLALRAFEFEGKKLQLISAYSAQQAREKITEHPSFSVALIDVVMETETAGLDLVRWIRDELKNDQLRIILRTGQPGMAPEWEVINQYQINDYTAKSELTQSRLYTSLVSAFRAYSQLHRIRQTQQGLDLVIRASQLIKQHTHLPEFAAEVAQQLQQVSGCDQIAILLKRDPHPWHSHHLIGKLGNLTEHDIQAMLPITQDPLIQLWSNYYLQSLNTAQQQQLLILISGPQRQLLEAKPVLEVYCAKIAMAFDHLYLLEQLNQQKQNLQLKVAKRTQQLFETGHTLKYQNQLDTDTRLPNRRYFQQLCEEAFSQAQSGEFEFGYALLTLKTSSIHGSLAAQFAELCQQHLRIHDLVGRLSDHEFAVIFSQLDVDQCVEALNNLISQMEQSMIAPSDLAKLSFTAGLAYSHNGKLHQLPQLMEQADRALFHTKQPSGPNIVIKTLE